MRWAITVLVILAIGTAVLSWGRPAWQKADIANRNVVKQTCSCIFVGERTLDQCIGDIPPAEAEHVKWTAFNLDRTPGAQRLTTTSFRIFTETAVYEPDTGCTVY